MTLKRRELNAELFGKKGSPRGDGFPQCPFATPGLVITAVH
jgi:hypothetical protein